MTPSLLCAQPVLAVSNARHRPQSRSPPPPSRPFPQACPGQRHPLTPLCSSLELCGFSVKSRLVTVGNAFLFQTKSQAASPGLGLEGAGLEPRAVLGGARPPPRRCKAHSGSQALQTALRRAEHMGWRFHSATSGEQPGLWPSLCTAAALRGSGETGFQGNQASGGGGRPLELTHRSPGSRAKPVGPWASRRSWWRGTTREWPGGSADLVLHAEAICLLQRM